jgi:hypothetical protein
MSASTADSEAVIDTLYRAARINLEQPLRRGNVIELSPETADDCLITGDLHGHVPNFEAILRLADLANRPRRHLVLQEVCHGGPSYPNGGCMSHRMLERIAELKTEYPERVHFLISNHELAELTDYPIIKANRLLNLVFRLGIQEVHGDEADRVRTAYGAFIRSLPLGVRLPGGIFICHSLPEGVASNGFDKDLLEREYEPSDLVPHSDLFAMVWGRDHRPENARAFASIVGAKILIHGHEPCPNGFAVPNGVQVILDCCGDEACYALLRTKPPPSHDEVVQCIGRLPR